MTQAEERTYVVDYDGLLRRPTPYRGWAIREKAVRELGAIPIAPAPPRKPAVSELDVGQAAYAEQVAGICRAVWNAALDQRRAAAQLNRGRAEARAVWPSFASQCRELAQAKRTEPWLGEAPSHCLQQTLRDLDKACRQHGVWRVRWRGKRRWEPSFRFPDATQIGEARRLGRHLGAVRLPKLGNVRFRWSRPLAGTVRNVTVQRDGRHWHITFCVENHLAESAPNGQPPVGIDRGVVIPVAASDGQCFDGVGMRLGEQRRLRHLQRRLAHQQKGSNRRRRTVRAIGACTSECAIVAPTSAIRRPTRSRPSTAWWSSKTCASRT